MEEAQRVAPQANQAVIKIPRKSTAVGYQSVETVPKEQESYDNKVSVTGKAPRFRRWLTALRRFPRWLISLLDRPWLLEVTSLLVACVALTAIIVTLAVHQGRPLPQWPQLISINSLIAIFTAILKASLIMPVAEGEP